MAIVIVPGSRYVDTAGFVRIKIMNEATEETLELKFAPGLTNEEMRAQGEATVGRIVATRQAAAAERQRITTISDGVSLYFKGTLSNLQKTNLLEALAREWRHG